MTRSEKKTEGPTSFQGLKTDPVEVLATAVLLPQEYLVVGIFHLDDGAVHQDPDRDGDAGEGHDVDGYAHHV